MTHLASTMTLENFSRFAFAVMVATVLAFIAGFSATAYADDEFLNRLVANRQDKHEALISALIGYGSEVGVPVSIEDVPEEMKGSLHAIYIDYDVKSSSTLRSVLDALAKKTGAFAWQQDGTAVNVISLALKKDNPFDEKGAAFRIRKGTQNDFWLLTDGKAKSLHASLTSFGSQYCGDPDAVVAFQTKETLPLRQVINRFGVAAGLRWCAEVGQLTKSPAPGFIPPHRTDISFFIYQTSKAMPSSPQAGRAAEIERDELVIWHYAGTQAHGTESSVTE